VITAQDPRSDYTGGDTNNLCGDKTRHGSAWTKKKKQWIDLGSRSYSRKATQKNLSGHKEDVALEVLKKDVGELVKGVLRGVGASDDHPPPTTTNPPQETPQKQTKNPPRIERNWNV